MLEAEYKRLFGLIADQITGATRAFYTYMEINKFASENDGNYQKISRDGHFWSVPRRSSKLSPVETSGRAFCHGQANAGNGASRSLSSALRNGSHAPICDIRDRTFEREIAWILVTWPMRPKA
jgi:hypothetical protein